MAKGKGGLSGGEKNGKKATIQKKTKQKKKNNSARLLRQNDTEQ